MNQKRMRVNKKMIPEIRLHREASRKLVNLLRQRKELDVKIEQLRTREK